MPTDLGRAMQRLTHRDIRTRRRAIRDLYEHDRPEALEGFVALLNDDDPWFVAKAVEAHRKWAPLQGVEALEPLLNHGDVGVRQAGANLLESFGMEAMDTARRLLSDADAAVQQHAARWLIKNGGESAHAELAVHPNVVVRRTLFTRTNLPSELLESGLNDRHESVQRLALQGILRSGSPVNTKAIEPHLNTSSPTPELVWWVAQHHPTMLAQLLPSLTGQARKALAKLLRESVRSSKDLHIERWFEADGHDLVAKWVLHRGQEEDALRWSLVGMEAVPLIERSILLERLIGRANDPTVRTAVAELLNNDLHPLLRVACENLSTAASELDA